MKEQHRVTSHDVKLFLDAKGAKMPCEVCGQSDWSIAESQEWFMLEIAQHLPVARTAPDGTQQQQQMVLPVVFIECENCGNIRLHSAHIIRGWLAQQDDGAHNE